MSDRAISPQVLGVLLDSLVAVWLPQVREWPPERFAAEGEEAALVIAIGGDVLFRGASDPSPADMRLPAPHALTVKQLRDGGLARDYRRGEILNALAKGLAMGSLVPGGVTFLGRHWCAEPHRGCPRAVPGVTR